MSLDDRIRWWVATHPTLFAFCLMALLGAVLVYYQQFQVRDELIRSCERVNLARDQINERRPVINTLVRIERAEGAEHRVDHRFPAHLHFVEDVTLTDCEAAFPRPFPLG